MDVDAIAKKYRLTKMERQRLAEYQIKQAQVTPKHVKAIWNEQTHTIEIYPMSTETAAE